MSDPTSIRRLASLASWGLLFQLAKAATVTPDHQTYLAGDDLVFSFAGGPGNATDWIGVYPAEIIPSGSPASTRWNYVNNTRRGTPGVRSGLVSFPGGVASPGTWNVFYLLNDGYSFIATNQFTVVDPNSPLVRARSMKYAPGQTIGISFTNGPANPLDWIAIYPLGQTPGAPGVNATLWYYVNGTKNGTTGKADGTIDFNGGLSTLGTYVAYLLLNDGYTILASDEFQVAAVQFPTPRLISLAPANSTTNAVPAEPFAAVLENGVATLVGASVSLQLDDAVVTPLITTVSNRVTIQFTPNNLFASNSTHRYRLVFADSAGGRQTNQTQFTVLPYREIQLNAPLYLETFDTITEGALPSGWTQQNYTDVLDELVDFNSLNSAAYRTWMVVNADRFQGRLITYSNPDGAVAEQEDMQRVLTPPTAAVVNGQQILRLAAGRMLFADSSYRNGSAQVMFTTTSDYNFTGRTNIHLSFHALMEQNQDSIATVEYSIDGGNNWLPIAYYLDPRDLVITDGAVDAAATLSAEQSDTARYTDEQGEDRGTTYGSYLAAPLTAVLPEHFQTRIDDNPVDGKRVELFRLLAADNQSRVRFRLGYAGTDSWYFGIDDFGLYSLSATSGLAGPLNIVRTGAQVRLSWTGAGRLQSASTLIAPVWQTVPGNSPVTVSAGNTAGFYRLVP